MPFRGEFRPAFAHQGEIFDWHRLGFSFPFAESRLTPRPPSLRPRRGAWMAFAPAPLSPARPGRSPPQIESCGLGPVCAGRTAARPSRASRARACPLAFRSARHLSMPAWSKPRFSGLL